MILFRGGIVLVTIPKESRTNIGQGKATWILKVVVFIAVIGITILVINTFVVVLVVANLVVIHTFLSTFFLNDTIDSC